jgi:hypothetical protein
MPLGDELPLNATGDAVAVDGSGFLFPTVPGGAGSAVVTNSLASMTAEEILAANPSRKGASFANASTKPMYLKYGSAGSLTDYSVIVQPGGYYELLPFTGQVWAVWPAVNGSVNITELT